MDYPIEEDFVFVPAEPTKEQSRAADLIYSITHVNHNRLLNCICHHGIDMVLNNPEILGVSLQEQQKITELRELLLHLKE